MGYKHRIDTKEMDTQLIAPVEGRDGIQVVVGTAPINMAEDPASAVNIPVIVYTFAEARKRLGYSEDFKSYTICQSMDASFRMFAVGPIVFINVLDPDKHAKDFTANDLPVTARKACVNTTGIILQSLKVSDQLENELVMDKDYIAAFNDLGEIDITLLTTDKTANVTGLKISGKQIDPSMVTEDDIIGGYDVATGKETGLEVIRQVYPRLGYTPGIILAPGWSEKANIAAVLAAKTEGISGVFTCEAAIDIDTETTRVYTGLEKAKEDLAVRSPHAILLWPKLRLNGKIYAYSAVWAAMAAYTDAQNNNVPVKSPSNERLNVEASVLSDGTEVILDTSMAEVVNSYGIVTAINDRGWKSWGNNTAAYPGTVDPKNRWIGCRRMMSWYRNQFILNYNSKVDDSANYRLIESLVDSENQYLNSLTSTGDIAGGEISFNEDDNPREEILSGHIIFKTKIAFWTPAEHIQNDIEFDPTILKNAVGGE